MVVRLLSSQAPALSLNAPPSMILDLQLAPQLLQVRQPLWRLCAVVACFDADIEPAHFQLCTTASALLLHTLRCPPGGASAPHLQLFMCLMG